jgi:phage terminase large subunit
MGATRIIIPYAPRPQQLRIHDALGEKRFAVVVAHRRLGKSVSAVNHLIREAIQNNREAPRYAYIGPTYSQTKRVIWDYLLKFTQPLNATANIAELRVDFWNRRIQLAGSDNPDSLRGQYFDGVVFDEFGDQDPRIWSEVVRPALSDRMGWALFLGTPKGANHFKTLRDHATEHNDWAMLEFKASETGLIPQSELDAARSEMGDDKYLQEFECSFDSAIEGAYYGQILNELPSERFGEIPRDGIAKTYCAWDLGIGDSTAIWVCQRVGLETRLIDFVENHGQGLDWYVNWLRTNNYELAEQLLPHDVQVRELGSGRSRLELLQEAGLNITIVPRMGVDDGIQAVRRLIPYCWFDPKTKRGVDALRNYRRQYDDKRQVYWDKPLHDWASHAADAFRYLAVGMNETTSWSKPLKPNVSWVV